MFVILLRAYWQMSISCRSLHHYLPVLSINEHYHPIVGWQLQHVLRRNKQLNEAHSNFTCHQSPRHDWLHSLMHKFMRLLHMMEYAWLKEVMDSRAAKNGHHLDCVRTFFKTTPSALLHSYLYTIPRLNASLGTDQWLSFNIRLEKSLESSFSYLQTGVQSIRLIIRPSVMMMKHLFDFLSSKSSMKQSQKVVGQSQLNVSLIWCV